MRPTGFKARAGTLERGMIMPSVYVQNQKIKDVVGRADYISNPARQEDIVLHKSEMTFEWSYYRDYERQNQKSNRANNEAREMIIALPNALDEDHPKLEKMCDELVQELIGRQHDFEYAVHWNHDRTNLHVHILFSEREVTSGELIPKKYKRDIWMNKDTHALAKAHSENAELVHKKGELMLDDSGKPKYETEPLTAKDKKFIPRGWLKEAHRITQKVFLNNGFEIDVREFSDPYLSQKKIYKNAREDYRTLAKKWNVEVKTYNKELKEYLDDKPKMKPTYIKIKKDILENVRDANLSSKSITYRAIELVQELIVSLKNVKTKFQVSAASIQKSWIETKKQFDDLFKMDQELEDEIKGLDGSIRERQNLNILYRESVDRKARLIQEMEEVNEQTIDR